MECRKRLTVPAFFFFTFLCLWQPLAAQTYIPDAKNAVIRFKIFIEKQKGTTIQGFVKGLQGKIEFSTDNPENGSFDMTVQAASVKTGDNTGDIRIKTSPYLFVKNFPKIKLKSTGIKRISKTAPIFEMAADLTIKEYTKKVKLLFTTEKTGENKMLFRGALEFNRTDFDLGDRSEMENTVTVYLEVPATIQPPKKIVVSAKKK